MPGAPTSGVLIGREGLARVQGRSRLLALSGRNRGSLPNSSQALGRRASKKSGCHLRSPIGSQLWLGHDRRALVEDSGSGQALRKQEAQGMLGTALGVLSAPWTTDHV